MTCFPWPLEGSLLLSPAPPWFLPSIRQEELKDHASQGSGPQCCVPADGHQAAGWAVGFEDNIGSLSSISPVGLFCFIEAPKLTGAEGNKHSHEVHRWIQITSLLMHGCLSFPVWDQMLSPERHLAQSSSQSQGPKHLLLSAPQHYRPSLEVALRRVLAV